MRTMKLAVPAAILAAGFLFCTSATYGKAEYAKKEKKACTFCHGKVGTDKEVMNNKCLARIAPKPFNSFFCLDTYSVTHYLFVNLIPDEQRRH